MAEAASDKPHVPICQPSDLSLLKHRSRRPSSAPISYRFSGNLKLTFKMGTAFICFRWEQNCRTAFLTHSTEFWTCVRKVMLQKASSFQELLLFNCKQWSGWRLPLVCRWTISALRIIPVFHSTNVTCDLKVQKPRKRTKSWFCLITENFTMIFEGSTVSPAYFIENNKSQ